jgi:transposase
MARPTIVDPALVELARSALQEIDDAGVSLRLQAIISCGSHQVRTVADVLGVDRVTLWRWVRRFRQLGSDGLRDRPKGHNPAKLHAEHREEITRWLMTGTDVKGNPTHWTLEKLALAIRKEFGIQIGRTPLWLTVRALGFRQRVPRPLHAKSDPEVQAEFKKNRSTRRRVSSRRGRGGSVHG